MKPTRRSVTIVNPLGGALEHYSDRLVAALSGAGVPVSVETLSEPSRGGGSRLGWLAAYVRVLVSLRRPARREGAVVLVVWPVLGYVDVVILWLLFGRRSRTHVVLHDPRPLVRAVGYSRFARRLARLASRPGTLIAQSGAARAVLDDLGFVEKTKTLPLPVGSPDGVPADTGAAIRVLGQYKGDRDTDLLERLAEELDGRYPLEIHGRGWPAVDGWRVVEGFVSEERFDHLVSSSGAVLIPYKRFYQSEVAVRCLENATPFVGPLESSLAEYYDKASPLLVATAGRGLDERAQDWSRAIDDACSMSEAELNEISTTASAEASRAWREWIQAA